MIVVHRAVMRVDEIDIENLFVWDRRETKEHREKST